MLQQRSMFLLLLLIQFIAINTSNGGQIKYLTPADKPEAVFTLGDGDEFISAIEYCNLHGLWEGK